MSDWQPIETAPSHTGRETKNLRILVVGGVHGTEPEIVLADGEWWRFRLAEGARHLPTHWMPLPLPPVSS